MNVKAPVLEFRRNTHPLQEWCNALILMLIPICIVITPKTIEIGAFRFMLAMGFTPLAIIFSYGTVGLARAAALIANGRWRHGVHCRAAGAAVGAFIWFHMALALMLLSSETGTLSVGIPVYLVMCVGEVLCARRVAIDAALAVQRERLRLAGDNRPIVETRNVHGLGRAA